jgi:nicotinamidase-related amidase
MRYLIVVDMQVDFITGALGTAEACAIVPRVVDKVRSFDGRVIFTKDTHGGDYMKTREGVRLPVPHCIKGTEGHELCEELRSLADEIVEKPTFGSVELVHLLQADGEVEYVELCGLCTDICVISNAMLLKAAFPEADVAVDAACSAGVTPASHKNALAAMRAVQIDVLNED